RGLAAARTSRRAVARACAPDDETGRPAASRIAPCDLARRWLAGLLVDHSHRRRRPAASTRLHRFDDEIAALERERALLFDRLLHHGERGGHDELVALPDCLRDLFLAAHARVPALG